MLKVCRYPEEAEVLNMDAFSQQCHVFRFFIRCTWGTATDTIFSIRIHPLRPAWNHVFGTSSPASHVQSERHVLSNDCKHWYYNTIRNIARCCNFAVGFSTIKIAGSRCSSAGSSRRRSTQDVTTERANEILNSDGSEAVTCLSQANKTQGHAFLYSE